MKQAIITAVALCAAGGPTMAQDRLDLPPAERRVASPSGAFTLTLRTPDNWKTPQVVASLVRGDGKVVWQQQLPHEHGPRRALVTDDGRVLLVDEWINVISPRALMLLAADGHIVAQHSAEAIFALLAVPLPVITRQAKSGAWIAEGPRLSLDSGTAAFEAGGRAFLIDLYEGRLYLR
jgi:hypothetical protein